MIGNKYTHTINVINNCIHMDAAWTESALSQLDLTGPNTMYTFVMTMRYRDRGASTYQLVGLLLVCPVRNREDRESSVKRQRRKIVRKKGRGLRKAARTELRPILHHGLYTHRCITTHQCHLSYKVAPNTANFDFQTAVVDNKPEIFIDDNP